MSDSKSILDSDMLVDMKTLASKVYALHQQSVTEITPQVRALIGCGLQDGAVIERTLDQLLESACIPEGLSLFKALCRYYWDINPRAAASYVDAYRQMWDAESLPAELANEALPEDGE